MRAAWRCGQSSGFWPQRRVHPRSASHSILWRFGQDQFHAHGALDREQLKIMVVPGKAQAKGAQLTLDPVQPLAKRPSPGGVVRAFLGRQPGADQGLDTQGRAICTALSKSRSSRAKGT